MKDESEMKKSKEGIWGSLIDLTELDEWKMHDFMS